MIGFDIQDLNKKNTGVFLFAFLYLNKMPWNDMLISIFQCIPLLKVSEGIIFFSCLVSGSKSIVGFSLSQWAPINSNRDFKGGKTLHRGKLKVVLRNWSYADFGEFLVGVSWAPFFLVGGGGVSNCMDGFYSNVAWWHRDWLVAILLASLKSKWYISNLPEPSLRPWFPNVSYYFSWHFMIFRDSGWIR